MENMNAKDAFKLGWDYMTGSHGKSKDYGKAVYYYKIAAKQGNPNAKANLKNLGYDE